MMSCDTSYDTVVLGAGSSPGHRSYPPERARVAAARRRKKLPSVTTRSPGFTPSRTSTRSPITGPSQHARRAPAVPDRHDLLDLTECEPEPLRLLDEAENTHRSEGGQAVAVLPTRRLRDHAVHLVEANCLGPDASALSHLADSQRVRPHVVESKPPPLVEGQADFSLAAAATVRIPAIAIT